MSSQEIDVEISKQMNLFQLFSQKIVGIYSSSQYEVDVAHVSHFFDKYSTFQFLCNDDILKIFPGIQINMVADDANKELVPKLFVELNKIIGNLKIYFQKKRDLVQTHAPQEDEPKTPDAENVLKNEVMKIFERIKNKIDQRDIEFLQNDFKEKSVIQIMKSALENTHPAHKTLKIILDELENVNFTDITQNADLYKMLPMLLSQFNKSGSSSSSSSRSTQPHNKRSQLLQKLQEKNKEFTKKMSDKKKPKKTDS